MKYVFMVNTYILQGRSSLVTMIGTAEAIQFVQSIGLLDLLCQKANEIDKKHPSTSNGYCTTLFSHYLAYHKVNTEPLWTELLGKMISISFSQPELVVEEAWFFFVLGGRIFNNLKIINNFWFVRGFCFFI